MSQSFIHILFQTLTNYEVEVQTCCEDNNNNKQTIMNTVLIATLGPILTWQLSGKYEKSCKMGPQSGISIGLIRCSPYSPTTGAKL